MFQTTGTTAMIRSTLLSLAVLAALGTTASAGGFGHLRCAYKQVRIIVGHDAHGNAIFKWVPDKICRKL